jgi:hypothetical protein
LGIDAIDNVEKDYKTHQKEIYTKLVDILKVLQLISNPSLMITYDFVTRDWLIKHAVILLTLNGLKSMRHFSLLHVCCISMITIPDGRNSVADDFGAPGSDRGVETYVANDHLLVGISSTHILVI